MMNKYYVITQIPELEELEMAIIDMKRLRNKYKKLNQESNKIIKDLENAMSVLSDRLEGVYDQD